MKAMIFAAGLGTRLGDITREKPKALVEVGGEPMLKRVILKLKSADVTDMVVNVHHHGEAIIDYLNANNNFGISISISDERDQLLDTGGGLLKARGFLEGHEPILIHNADILTDFDIQEMVRAHSLSESDATLLVANRSTSRYLLFDRNMRMIGWKNVKTGEVRSPFENLMKNQGCFEKEIQPLAFGGVHIVNPSIFPMLASYTDEAKFSITPFYTDSCAALRIKGYLPSQKYNWIDIGKPDSLTAAENIVSKLRPIQPEE